MQKPKIIRTKPEFHQKLKEHFLLLEHLWETVVLSVSSTRYIVTVQKFINFKPFRNRTDIMDAGVPIPVALASMLIGSGTL